MQFLIIFIILFSSFSYSSPYSLCGDDNRVSISKAPIARLSNEKGQRGCTATLIGKRCAITAGHCNRKLSFGEFSTPYSVDREPTPSAEEDLFPVDQESVIFHDGGRGNDWAVFKFKKNKITGKLPGEVHGYFEIELHEPSNSELLNISGYGTHYTDPSLNLTLLQGEGNADYIGYSPVGRTLLNHFIDTTGGSSGSSVVRVSSGKIIAIHGQGGCDSHLIWNSATLIKGHQPLQNAIEACLNED